VLARAMKGRRRQGLTQALSLRRGASVAKHWARLISRTEWLLDRGGRIIEKRVLFEYSGGGYRRKVTKQTKSKEQSPHQRVLILWVVSRLKAWLSFSLSGVPACCGGKRT
jgi:hypothetical protein